MNPLSRWIENDPKLQAIIQRISDTGKSFEEQAKVAFYEISEAYRVPKYPLDITEADQQLAETQGLDKPTTVFEEFAKIKYCYPEDDVRGMVLMAIYNAKHQMLFDITECAKVHFGSKRKIPKSYMVYFLGEDIESRLYFPVEGDKSWTEMGAKTASRVVKI
jgi:hypothetical protein